MLLNARVLLKKANKFLLLLIFSIVAGSVVLPLLRSGYIFAMDLVFPPHFTIADNFTFLDSILWAVNSILPSALIQKSIFFFIIVFAGVGMYRLVPVETIWPKIFAGLLYAINPFVYSRFLYGQIFLLLAYALVPFGIRACLVACQHKSWKNTLKLIGWFVVIDTINVHVSALFVLYICVAGLLYHFHQRKTSTQSWYAWLAVCIVPIGLFFLWVYFVRFGWSDALGGIQQMGDDQLIAFQTVADERWGLTANVLSLYGFWGDNTGQYIVQKALVPAWPILAVVVFSIVCIGAWQGVQHRGNTQIQAVIFMIVMVIAVIISLGIGSPVVGKFNLWLYHNVPFFYGFREPQKFVALLCLSYAFFGALGLQYVVKLLRKRTVLLSATIGGALVLPLLYSPGLFWGFHGQLRINAYPLEWYEVNQLLNNDRTNSRALFLPWHQYMYFNFAQKIIANPAATFFDKDVIIGDNLELGKIKTASTSKESLYIESLLQNKTTTTLGTQLQPLNIKYIILAKEADYQKYDFLQLQSDLQVIYDGSIITVYHNQAL